MLCHYVEKINEKHFFYSENKPHTTMKKPGEQPEQQQRVPYAAERPGPESRSALYVSSDLSAKGRRLGLDQSGGPPDDTPHVVDKTGYQAGHPHETADTEGTVERVTAAIKGMWTGTKDAAQHGGTNAA